MFRKSSAIVRFCRILIPQLLLVLLLAGYLIGSALVFRHLDEGLRNQSFYDVILFEFSTITTIGYGNITPSADGARLFAILFSIIGIPITLLTLANLGKHTSKAFWHGARKCGMPWADARVAADAPLPLPFILCLFAFTFLFGSMGIDHTKAIHSTDHFYFSFISFTTVGFGDMVPVTSDLRSLLVTLSYLTWGCMLMTSLFSVLSGYFRKVHYLGRRFAGARDVPVWVGGRCITVSQLLMAVGEEFEASPREIRCMLRDLDDVIPTLQERKMTKGPPIVKHLEDFDCYE